MGLTGFGGIGNGNGGFGGNNGGFGGIGGNNGNNSNVDGIKNPLDIPLGGNSSLEIRPTTLSYKDMSGKHTAYGVSITFKF